MAKRSSRRLSKKGLTGLRRVLRKIDNRRVWLFRGREYDDLRSVVMFNTLNALGLNRQSEGETAT